MAGQNFPKNPAFGRPLAPLVLPAVYDDVLSYEEWLSKVIYQINELTDYINNTMTNLESIVDDRVRENLAEVYSRINSVRSELEMQIEELGSRCNDLDLKIDKTLVDAIKYTDDAVREINSDLANMEQAIRDALAEAEEYCDHNTAGIDEKVNRIYAELKLDLDTQTALVNERIDNIIKEYPQIYDPSTGYMENFQTLVYKLFNSLRYFGATAIKYDGEELTAEEYDNMLLKAIKYDTDVMRVLFDDLKNMFNPFTGKRESIKQVVSTLVRKLQWNAKTSTEYDGFEATASEFDASTFDAYEQDTNQYITETTPDVKNKKFQNLRYIGKVRTEQFFDTGYAYADAIGKEFVVTYAVRNVFEAVSMASVSFVVNFGIEDTPMHITLPNSDVEVGFSVIMYNGKLFIDNSSFFDFDVFVKTDVFDVSELDK